MSPLDSQAVVRVLSEIAQTASETLELQDVFTRVAASIRTLVPLENMGVVRIVDEDIAVVHATTVLCSDVEPACSQPRPLTFWSERIRPSPYPIARVQDAATDLDPSYPGDADIIGKGVRSAMWEPFPPTGGFRGGIWLSSSQPDAFDEEHQKVLAPIAAILSSAVEHWRIWDAERRRRERLDRLERLLGSFAASLDVRDVFGTISEAVQEVLPHDLLVLTELDERAGTIRVAAIAGHADIPTPTEPLRLTEEELARREQSFEVLTDIPAQVKPDTARSAILLATGMRSWLRVPVRLLGEVRGGIGFFHREASRYSEEDVEVARRLADRVALVNSHQRLADEARLAAEACERAQKLEATVETLTRELEAQGRVRVIGVSRSWKQVLLQIGRVASSETTVLVLGESGTGKEVVSRLIHQGSTRAGRPLVAINCAALPEQLLESELFGHEKGAFTGAVATKVGTIEQAAGSTLFLDEITEMSPVVQAKFLRVLQEREFQRVGGTRTLRADVRVIAATNRNLTEAIQQGRFREDLYYRLNVFEIHVPALRERPEDILPLAEAFLEDLGRSMGRPSAGISRDAREWLLSYPWPGNVRELRNAVERAILLCDGGLIAREHLPVPRPAAAGLPTEAYAGGNGGLNLSSPLPPGGVDLAEVDRSLVEQALKQAAGNKSRAARLLGLTRSQLYSRIEKYKLTSLP